jgi:hypothetical protein
VIALSRKIFPLVLIYIVHYYCILVLIVNSDDSIHPGADVTPAVVQGTQSDPKVMTSTCPLSSRTLSTFLTGQEATD